VATRPTLERIVLKNFNSFKVDEVPFHKGFTVITGPNGAGKSTIFQGIKFSLGSNEKDGRAKVWSDFIRIGQNAGYAEIQLRDKKKIIKIRRTIIKGQAPFYQMQAGEDQKLKKCTASTIQALLTEFGINPDNVFAFVSQGNITSIKNMEKKEICDYLEKGLGLYPLRGEILDNKATIHNLDAQINSLQLMDKTATYELNILAPQIVRLNEKKILEVDRDHLEKERIWLNRAKIEEEIQQIQEEIKKLEQNGDKLEEEKNAVSITLDRLESSIKDSNAKIAALSQTILDEKIKEKSLDVEIDRWQQDKDNYGDKILRTKSKIKLLKAEQQRFTEDQKICLAEIKKHKFELSILNQQRKSHMEEFESHQNTRKKYQNIMIKYRELKDQKNGIELSAKENTLEIEAIDRDVKSCMNEIRYLRQELESDKWFLKDPEKNSMNSLTQKKKKINFALEKLSRNTTELEKESQELDKQVEQLKSSVMMKELPKSTAILNLMKEIQSRNLDVIGPIIDFIEFNPDITLAVDSILSKYVLNSFIAKNKQDFYLLHDLIKRTGARCNVYQPFPKDIRDYKAVKKEDGVFGYLVDFIKPLSNHDSVNKVLVSIIRNTILVNDRSIGYDFIKQNDHRGRVVAMDGTVIRSYEYVMESRASESRKTYSNPIEQKREVKKIQNQIMGNRKKIDEYRQKKSKLEQALNLLQDRLQKINSVTFNYKKMTITINKKDNLLQKKAKLTEQKNFLNSDIISVQVEIDNVQKKFPKNFDEMDKFNDEFQTTIGDLDSKIEVTNAILTSKAKEENRYALNIEKFGIDLETYTAKLTKFENELKSGNSRLLEAINEIGKVRDTVDTLVKEQQKLSDSILNIQKVIQTEQHSLNSITQAIDRVLMKIEIANAQIYDKQKMVESITIEVSELGENYEERTIEEVENDLRVIYEKLREYYDVTDQLLDRKQELEDQLIRTAEKKSELDKEVNEAKKSVDTLQDQYFSMFEGHLQTIQSNINQRFQKIGINRKGLLSFIGEFENLGVEINVQFEDTSRKISSLSGGEQTLFAISLMLTLQNLNPSPLCIFDEAQMFLDKSNAENVSKLIKDVTESGVQFIMITPNAANSLLELADCVLGVAKNGSEEVSTVIPL